MQSAKQSKAKQVATALGDTARESGRHRKESRRYTVSPLWLVRASEWLHDPATRTRVFGAACVRIDIYRAYQQSRTALASRLASHRGLISKTEDCSRILPTNGRDPCFSGHVNVWSCRAFSPWARVLRSASEIYFVLALPRGCLPCTPQ